MKIESNGITIYLEQNEICDFWNIVAFALDLQDERDKEQRPCMTDDELRLARKLHKILDELK